MVSAYNAYRLIVAISGKILTGIKCYSISSIVAQIYCPCISIISRFSNNGLIIICISYSIIRYEIGVRYIWHTLCGQLTRKVAHEHIGRCILLSIYFRISI